VLRAVGVIGCAAWTLAFMIFVFNISKPVDETGHEVGGDFFHFYAAGRLLLEGRGHELYDMRAQQDAQRRILDDPTFNKLALYINPPTLAAAIAPLSALPYAVAFTLYSLLMLAAFLAAMHRLRPWLPALHSQWATVVMLGLCFYPIVRTITGGQNTALTLLLLCGAYAALREGKALQAGLWIGLLGYKPQMALLLSLLLAFRRQWRCVGAAAIVAVVHYGVGAIFCGFRWPMEMIDALERYRPLETIASGYSHISWMEVCRFSMSEPWSHWSGSALVLSTAVLTLWFWRRARPREANFAVHWAMAIPATLLISPHAQFYDAGLLLISVLLIVDTRLRNGGTVSNFSCIVLAVAFLLFPAYLLAQWIGFQPLVLLPVSVWLWSASMLVGRSSLFPNWRRALSSSKLTVRSAANGL